MNLTNHFLVAMPSMKDPYFKRSVIYICEHNQDGAMGLMINAPIDITVGGMLKQVDIEPAYPQSHQESLKSRCLMGDLCRKIAGLFCIVRAITTNRA